jgi:hypothetical protein
MIEKIDLSTFKILTNQVLIKVDPNHDFVTINGFGGKKVELQLVSFGEHEINHVSISGTVIAKPEKPYYFKRNDNLAQQEFASLMKNSLPADCDFPIEVGTKVYFNYSNQLNAENERRLVETDEHGICMLCRLDSLFGYEQEGEVKPLNGYVFFKRDKDEDEVTFENGLIGIQKAQKYGSYKGTVIKADKPVRAYQEGHNEPQVDLNEGQRMVIDKRFGYRMAYDMHGGQLESVEVIQRRHILALID